MARNSGNRNSNPASRNLFGAARHPASASDGSLFINRAPSFKLFGEYGGYAAGSQMRDFVFIDDVVAVNLWFFDHPGISGIFIPARLVAVSTLTNFWMIW